MMDQCAFVTYREIRRESDMQFPILIKHTNGVQQVITTPEKLPKEFVVLKTSVPFPPLTFGAFVLKPLFIDLMALMMVSDPWPLKSEVRVRMEEFLNDTAKVHGFENWIDAYHVMRAE